MAAGFVGDSAISLQIIHCSDLHLDRSFNFSNLGRVAERKADLNNNFSEIVNYALKNKPDLFLVSGDVFDKILPSNAVRVYLTQQIRRLNDANIAVFLIGGNHEVPRFGVYPLAIDVLDSAGIATVFSGSDVIQENKLNIHGQSVSVAGKSYFTQFERAQLKMKSKQYAQIERLLIQLRNDGRKLGTITNYKKIFGRIVERRCRPI